MKSILVFGLMLSGALAFAQSSTTTTKKSSEGSILSKIAAPAPAKPVFKKRTASASGTSMENTSTTTYRQTSSSSSLFSAEHFSAGLTFVGASELRGIKVKTGENRGAITGTTSSGLALAGQYRYYFAPEWAMTGALAIHQSKDIGKLNGSVENQRISATLGSKPSFQPWVLAVNGEYHLNDVVYFPGGLNTTIMNVIHAGPFDSMTMDPRLGFQAGVGASLNKMVDVELTYQSLRYELNAHTNNDFLADGSVTYDGINLTGRYVF